MSEAETEQTTVFGETLDEQVHIETSGRVIRPAKRMLDQIADEYKIQCNNDGLFVKTVDAGNVVMVALDVPSSSFEAYDVEDGTVLGTSGSGLGSALQHARYGKSTDDPLVLTADQKHLKTEVTREIQGYEAEVNEQIELIDPKSIRQEPDLPDLDLEVKLDLSPDAFCETIRMFDDDEEIRFKSEGDNLILKQKGGETKRQISLTAEPSNDCGWAIFTADYLHDFAKAVQNGYVDDLTLKWGEDYPLVLDFEREDVYSGRLMVAPRIKSD